MHRIFTFLLFLCLGVHTMAKTIKGSIVDKQTGEPVTGAVIKVDETSYYAVSGLDGSFTIKNIHKGDYKIIVSMVGFITETRNVKLGEDDIVLPVIEFRPDQKELSAVEIKTTRDKTTDASARNLEKTSGNELNVVSARAIEISPDLTVANVIQRVSGVTIERNNTGDGQYALIRGMDKRFSYTLVNGVKIPSPDNKNRYVPLDIFPAELLDRLEVIKSLTPDMEGDGIAGAVNMVMKDAPDRLVVSGNVATGFNTLFFNRPFYTFDKSQIQTKSPAEVYGPGYPAVPADFNNRLIDLKKMGFKPNLYAGLSLGNRFLDDKLGVIVAGTYQNSLRGSNSKYFSSGVSTSDASNSVQISNLDNRTFSEEQTRAGLHTKLDYRFSQDHKLEFYSAFLDFKTYQVRDERNTDLSVGYDPANNSYNLTYDTRFRYTHQQILSNTLKGDHKFGDRFSMDWSAVYSKATNEVPDNSELHLASNVTKGVESPKAVVVLGGEDVKWEHNSDEDKAGYLNFRYKLGDEDMPIVISAGGMYRDKQRTTYFTSYDLRPTTNEVQGTAWENNSDIQFYVDNPTGTPGDPLNYQASEKIGAAYLEGKLTSDKFEAIAGARAENTDQGYHLDYPTTGVQPIGEQKYTDILPSVNLKYKLNDKTNLRASYYEAINRPSFYEIVPGTDNDNDDWTQKGNANVKHTVAHNADLRYELFPKPSEQLLVGAFYKRLINPIELGIAQQGQNSYYTPTNFGIATNYGFELDYTKYIYNFGIKLNYTYTNSSITTDKLYKSPNPDPTATDKIQTDTTNQTRRLAGQAAHVANLTFLYKSVKKGVDAQLSFAYTGDRIIAVSSYINNDIWQSGFVQLDASAEKKVGNHFVVFLKATNLLNTPVKDYVKNVNPVNAKIPGYETFNGGTVTRSDVYGQTIMLGIRFKY